MAGLNDFPETPQNPYANVGGPQGPTAPADQESNRDARMWAMFAHLAGLAGFATAGIAFILGPLVIWLIKKDQYPFVDEQGKEALNFQITMFIYAIVAGLLWFVCIGIVLLPLVGLADIVFTVIAMLKVNDGYHYRYPHGLIFRFIK